jgi:anti-sigma B factor antagonist
MNVELRTAVDPQHGVARVVAVTGEIDMQHSPALRQALLGELETGPQVLAVDLSGVGFMDSSGVATLVEALKLCKTAGISLVLCGLTPKVLDVFSLARLDRVFKIVPGIGQIFGS